LPPLSAATWVGPVDQLRAKAEQCEKRSQWTEARKVWEQILIQDRNTPGAREHYLFCLRRAQQVVRHADATYRQQAQSLSLQEVLQVYGEILARLKAEYVDHERVEISLLFNQGLEEFRLVLGDETFRQTYLSGVPADAIRAFQSQLQSDWNEFLVRRPEDAQAQAREIAFAAHKRLGLRPTLVVLEFACGACNSLDEYTSYLTPAQFNELNASWKGEAVGIGIEVAPDNQKQLAVVHVIPGGPAHLKGNLKAGDRILRIGNRDATNLAAEAAAEMLKGEVDTDVELVVLSPGDPRPHLVTLRRQTIRMPSVSSPHFLDMQQAIGYLQLVSFQESTPAELDDAILKLQTAGMKVLILDLRGNAGGLFEEARQVVERFMSSGIIVSTQGQVLEYNATYYAHGMNALTVPLVVLVDGETASCAEMVAGALKDNLRGRLVGKTTFGKGSIQKVRKLNTLPPAGLRMTVAKFYSPRGQPYSGLGVAPHLDVAGSDMTLDPEQDPQVQAALDVARSLVMGR
jgi:carboxyl-terminal processing protease